MKHHFSPYFLILFSVAFLNSEVSAKEPAWTGWRGAERDATVLDFVAPETWPEKMGKIWTAEVGDGYATPLVVGDRVYQHARVGAEEVLWCLNLKDGKPLWRKSTAVEFVAGRGGEKHGLGPKSTPTIADGRVFTLSITGVFSAWSAENGEVLWVRDFKERLEKAFPYWGTATSPIAEDGRLFVHVGTCENGALYCLDQKTGKDIWVRDEDPNCYSSPLMKRSMASVSLWS